MYEKSEERVVGEYIDLISWIESKANNEEFQTE